MSDTRPQSSTSIVERLRFDALRCELQFSKGIADNIEEGIAEIERLRAALQDLIDRWPTEQGYDGAIKRARRALLARRSFSEGGEGK